MRSILLITLLIAVTGLYGQHKAVFIEPYLLEVSAGKTTNLVFPSSVKSVDRGSEDLLAAKADGSRNILHVKAARDSMRETNLTVILTDGTLYSFIVRFNANPQRLNLQFGNGDSSQVAIYAKKVLLKKKMFEHLIVRHSWVSLQLLGLYTASDVLFLQLGLQNRSNTSYEIEAIRFFIRDKQKTRRTASQETELTPQYLLGLPTTIDAKHQQLGVIALGKFSIPDNKYLALHILEKNGERDLYLKLINSKLIKAKPL